MPKYWNDISNFMEGISVVVDKEFDSLPHNITCLLVVPHLGESKHFLYKWLKLASKNKVPIFFYNFETPNWLKDEGVDNRSWWRWIPYRDCALQSNAIISMVDVADSFAQEYFKDFSGQFYVCPPPLNPAIESAQNPPSTEYDVFLFIRTGANEAHKGAGLVEEFLRIVDSNARIIIFGDVQRMNVASKVMIESIGIARGLNIQFTGTISDVEKYRILSATKVVALFSRFEGFGYIPIEAASCGAQVVLFDIPVFKSLHWGTQGFHFIPKNNIRLMVEVVNALVKQKRCLDSVTVESYRRRFSVDQIGSRMVQILGTNATAQSRVPIRFTLKYWGYWIEQRCRILRRLL